jgi:hypothetical protein
VSGFFPAAPGTWSKHKNSLIKKSGAFFALSRFTGFSRRVAIGPGGCPELLQSSRIAFPPWTRRGLALLTLIGGAVVAAPAVTAQLFVAAADRGECIESEVYRMIRERGGQSAGSLVAAALEALNLRERQQRKLGCAGDIAAQAIAAGADPDQVLRATAAGL